MSPTRIMKRYLLGEVSEEERIDLENRYLSDATLFEELTEAENDLIDSYVRGRLSDHDKQEFEKQYLTSTERRARVQFASAFSEISREHEAVSSAQKSSFWERLTSLFSQPTPKLQWGMALAGLAVVLAIGWVTVHHDRSLQATLPPMQPSSSPASPTPTTPVPNNQAPSSENTGGTELAKADRPELDEFTVQLTPGLARGIEAGTKTFSVPKTPWIEFRLLLENDEHRNYSAVVETAEGNEVWHVDGIKSLLLHGNKVVDVRVPSKIVKPGDYVIRLGEMRTIHSNQEDIAVYSFRALSR